MGYSYLYLFCLLILVMFLLRFFVPFLVYLIPIFLIVYLVKAIFKKGKTNTSTYEKTYYDEQKIYNQTKQSSNPDVIDVDYKVVDEEDNDTH